MKSRLAFILLAISMTGLLLMFAGCQKAEQKKEEAAAAPAAPVVNYNEMVFVPAGKCIIGGAADQAITKFSSPPHEVDLKSFWIDKYEVTFEQFLMFVAETGHPTQGNWRDFFSDDRAMDPVVNVTLEDAQAYAEWQGKRIPTQEEWEKAASWDPVNSTKRVYPWGDKWEEGRANTAEAGFRKPVPIGQMAGDVSFYGAHDMLGNVYEWSNSIYDRYPGSKLNDPNFRLKLYTLKGASCYLSGQNWNLAARTAFPKNVLKGQGFRCAKDATPEDEAQYTDQVIKEGKAVTKAFEKK